METEDVERVAKFHVDRKAKAGNVASWLNKTLAKFEIGLSILIGLVILVVVGRVSDKLLNVSGLTDRIYYSDEREFKRTLGNAFENGEIDEDEGRAFLDFYQQDHWIRLNSSRVINVTHLIASGWLAYFITHRLFLRYRSLKFRKKLEAYQ